MVLMIVSGRSGSGKSVALRALEDMGFYCVDNLPVVLLPDLARTLADRQISAAVSIDVRNMPESPEIFEQAMNNLPEGFSPQLLFLDADRNTLIRRYSDTRRLHPLSSKNLSLESAIDKESDLLEPLRSRADLIVDTSEMSVHELAEMLRTRLLGKRERELTMVFESFGFKHGIPIDADYVFDVRFLPNPHWDPKLRPMTGLDRPVAGDEDRAHAVAHPEQVRTGRQRTGLGRVCHQLREVELHVHAGFWRTEPLAVDVRHQRQVHLVVLPRIVQLVRRHGQQLRRSEEQLLAGQEHMAVGGVVLQLIGQRRPQAGVRPGQGRATAAGDRKSVV